MWLLKDTVTVQLTPHSVFALETDVKPSAVSDAEIGREGGGASCWIWFSEGHFQLGRTFIEGIISCHTHLLKSLDSNLDLLSFVKIETIIYNIIFVRCFLCIFQSKCSLQLV